MISTPLLAALLVFTPGLHETDDPEAHWAHWRGPTASGVAPGPAVTVWSDDENVRWKVPLPGRGVSSPIVWGNRLFVTTAVPVEGDDEASGPQSFEVHCLDRDTGRTLWRRVACVATPHEGFHRSYGSWASASPVTDGERLHVSFGSRGLYTYDLEGELLWSHKHGVALEMRRGFGEGHTPVLAGDVLVQACDQESDSFIVAIDRATGTERWRKQRDEPSAWATPLVTVHEERLQVITAGTNRIRAYAPGSGELLWECGGLGLNVIPAVTRWQDTIVAMSGYRSPNVVAVRLGGEGDLTGSESVAWSSPKGAAYTASPVMHDGLYYSVSDRGFISCFDVASGEAAYLEQRLPQGSTLKSSPVAAGDYLYVPTEAGDVHLIRLGPTYELARTNSLADQTFVASPAVAEGALYLRSMTHLLCVAED